MSFDLPQFIDEILQHQYDDRRHLAKADAPRSKNTWNNRMRQKIHAMVERNWPTVREFFPRSESLMFGCGVSLMFTGVLILGLPWAWKVPLMLAVIAVGYFASHAYWGMERMRYKNRLETPWGETATLVKEVVEKRYEGHMYGNMKEYSTFKKKLLTKEQYTGLLYALKQHAIRSSNDRARNTAQYLIERIDSTSAYFATMLAEKLEEEFKVNAWSVVDLNYVSVETAPPPTNSKKSDSLKI